MKQELNTALKAIIIVLAMTILGCFLLVVSFCLPTARMRQHLAESYPLIESEHQYLQWDQGYTSSMLDFWSEYTLYGAAINEDAEGTAFEKAMMMWYIDTPGMDRDKAVEQYARYPDKHFELTEYPRYWNGAVIFMKLFLLQFTIHDIRMINMFIVIALLLLLSFLMARKNMLIEMVELTTAILFINPITMIYSVVYLVEFIPMLLGIIVLLLYGNKIDALRGGWSLFFAIMGALTSFFSFLSSPFITLGIPLVVYIWYTKEKGVVKKVISSTCYWGGAYALIWLMKWIICTLFTSYNLIANVFDRVDIYENADNIENSGTTIIERLMHNLWAYKTPAFMVLFVFAVVLIGVFAWRRDDHFETGDNIFDVIGGYALIAIMPICILVGLGNGYAYNHYFMAHRNLSITVLAVLCIIRKLVNYIHMGMRGITDRSK